MYLLLEEDATEAAVVNTLTMIFLSAERQYVNVHDTSRMVVINWNATNQAHRRKNSFDNPGLNFGP